MKLQTLLTILFSFFIMVIFVPPAIAQQYPIKELGSCSGAASCYNYCQIPENTPACWSYGKYILRKNVLGEQTMSAEEAAKKHGLTFPIAELGNCTSPQACMNYCNQPTNHQACSEFGQKKGLTKQHAQQKEQKEKLMQAAKEKLGCTDENSCRAFCSEPANQEKCSQVAREVGLHRAAEVSQSSKPQELLEKAKNELGCDSQDSCMNFCSKAENKEKCMEFGKKHKQERRDEKREYREDWCKENLDRCREMHELKASDAPQKYEDKMEFCKENPEKCKQIREDNAEKREMKKEHWEMKKGCTTEGECMSICQQSPDRCPGFQKPSGIPQGRPEGNFQKPEDMKMRDETYQSMPQQQPQPQEVNN